MAPIVIALLAASLAAAQPSETAQRQARSAPEWVRRAIVYQVWLRSFTPEATLAAARDRLATVSALGATVIYLSPVQKMSESGGFTNPYRIADYSRVDPLYGTEADLKAFVDEAHRLQLKVLMDIVFYHTGPDNVLMADPANYLRTPGGEIQKGTWGLPRLDFSNRKLRAALIENLLHWIRDVGVDGFRCDVAAGIPLDFWEEARAAIGKVRPDAFLLAESDLPAEQLAAFDASYDFKYYETLAAILRDGEPASRLRRHWQSIRAAFPKGARFLQLSDNHDRERADVVFGQKGALATAVLNFTLDGIPFIYNGQEIGDRTPTSHNRKTPIQWDLLSRRETHRPLFARLIELRKSEPALHSGEVIWIDNDQPDSVVSFIRRAGAEEVLVAVNLSNRKLDVTLELPVSGYTPIDDLLKKKRSGFAMAPGRPVLSLSAFESAVLKRIKPEPVAQARPSRPVNTYSIVARDPATGDIGVAVQSHWFSVGALVPWAEAGVGAVATQSFVDPSYGRLGLELMRAGRPAPDALRGLLEADTGRDVRQVAMIDVQGRVAAHTGAKNIPAAGHSTGAQFSVQANMMLRETVWPAMAKAYSESKGDLADRMMAALEAAEAQGGDVRGKQSAALIVVKGASTGRPWLDRVFDLRVDDHPAPLVELRRLLTLARAYNHMNAGDLAVENRDDPGALREYSAAAALAPQNAEMVYWRAVALVNMGRVEDALPLFRDIFRKEPGWAALTERLPPVGLMNATSEILKRILSQR